MKCLNLTSGPWRGLALGAWLLAGTPAAALASPATPPNLLWITSEDNSPYLGCYGDPLAHTPHLDRLAGQGVRYRRAFANAPVCSTARTTLITGMYASTLGAQHHRSRVRMPEDFQLYPELLRAAGYYCSNNAKEDYNLAGRASPWDDSSRTAHYRNRRPGQPFFAVFNLTSSHEGQVAPPPTKTEFRVSPGRITLPPYHPDTPEIRRDWANYYDQMTLMDRQVGAILAELEESALEHDTLVFYFSDHGGALPRGKRNLHDSGTRVPLIIRIPEKWSHHAPAGPGEWVEELVSFVDLPATLLSLAGVPVPAYYEGRPFLGTHRATPHPQVFLFRDRMDERTDTVRAIRDREFRYVRNYSPHRPWGQHYTYAFGVLPGMRSWHDEFIAGRCDPVQSAYWQPKPVEELYAPDLDPFEIRNLASHPDHQDRLNAMRRRLQEEILSSRDTGFVPEGMLARLTARSTAYEFARSKAYPLEPILAMAESATRRDPGTLPELIAGLEDPHPAIRYWAAIGCVILAEQAAPAEDRLHARLEDAYADVRVAAAEAIAGLGKSAAALDTLAAVLATGNVPEVLAAQNALEYLWRAGHVPLTAAQDLLRGRAFTEPAQRIPEFLLGLPADAAARSGPETVGPTFQLAIAEFNELACDDCDGVALGDIAGNGRTDLLLSNGKGGETFWYEQGATPHVWTRHSIFTVPGPHREIEGNDLGDFNGDGRLEAVSLDQPNGVVYLHAHDGDPRGAWQTVALQRDRPLVQASLVTDVDEDGRPDLIYTWEGRQPGSGGVHWLRFTGTNLLDPSHWQDHVLIQHESAWWIAPRRLDLSGNGRTTDLVFTARNLKGRNPGARPGVFWLQEPSNPADRTRPWKRHTIDDTLNHPLHVDAGDLSGHGHGRDLVVGGFDTHRLHWYSFSEGWKRHALPLPHLDGELPDRIWNVKTARFGGARDGILTPVTRGRKGALLFFEFTGEQHEPNLLRRIDYDHPMDDRIILQDLDGDGLEEAFIPDSGSGHSRFVWIRFRHPNPTTAELR